MLSELLEQIEVCRSQKLYYIAMSAALMVPEICGAIESSDGRGTRTKYAQWFDTYLGEKYKSEIWDVSLTGADCYQCRCALLHQGRSRSDNNTFRKITFIVPKDGISFRVMGSKEDSLLICLPAFCNDIVVAASDWMEKMEIEGSENYQRHMAETASIFSLSFE
jgi:hypothetical protein